MANKNQTPAYPVNVRTRWYSLVDRRGKKVDEVCDMYFISRKTYYKWRMYDLGSTAYVRRKEHPETKIKGAVRVLIYDEKKRVNYGPKKMKLLVKRRFDIDVSTTAIYKFYKKKDLIPKNSSMLASVHVSIKQWNMSERGTMSHSSYTT